jgi:hypothetical protein
MQVYAAEVFAMKMSLLSTCLLMGTSVALATACDRNNDDRASTTRTTSFNPPAPISPASIDAIALARCDREDHCSNIGDGRKFANRDACVSQFQAKGDNDLTTSACPAGIDTPKLQACLDEIRTERCDNPLDTIGRLTACRVDALCPVSALQGD